jgi:hypothetical protein
MTPGPLQECRLRSSCRLFTKRIPVVLLLLALWCSASARLRRTGALLSEPYSVPEQGAKAGKAAAAGAGERGRSQAKRQAAKSKNSAGGAGKARGRTVQAKNSTGGARKASGGARQAKTSTGDAGQPKPGAGASGSAQSAKWAPTAPVMEAAGPAVDARGTAGAVLRRATPATAAQAAPEGGKAGGADPPASVSPGAGQRPKGAVLNFWQVRLWLVCAQRLVEACTSLYWNE